MFKPLVLVTSLMALTVTMQTAHAAASNWGGVYGGVQAGYSLTDYDSGFDLAPTNNYTTSGNMDGWFGGLYAGYNIPTANKLVWGVEFDVNRGDQSNKGTWFYHDGFLNHCCGYAEMNWSGSARLRLGYDAGRYLPYVAGGLAFADVDAGYDYEDQIAYPGWGDGGSGMTAGWSLGAGVDYAYTNNIIMRVEYRYTDYRTANMPWYDHPAGGDAGPGNSSSGHIDMTSNTVTVGVAYKF